MNKRIKTSTHRYSTNSLTWYMSGQALWFLAQGIQMVAFQIIGVLVLNLDAGLMGLAQASILIPSLFLTLPAGVIAERNDKRRILILTQLCAILPALLLGYMVLTRQVQLLHLVIFGLAMGAIGALVLPARDALLSHIVGIKKIQRAVNIALIFQFAALLLGMVFVSSADFIDIGWMSILQACALLGAVIVAFKLPKNLQSQSQSARSLESRLPQMIDGLRVAFTHKDIAPMLFLQSGISIFYIGPFLVLLPILVRDYYGGTSADIALLNILFWAGAIGAMITLIRIGLIPAVGKLLAGAVSSGLLIIGVLALPKPFWMLAILCVVWGGAAGCSMSSGRTIVQNRAPDNYRARILSIYQLSFMGGAPIGALLTGLAVDWFGIHQAPLFSMLGMGIMIFIILTSTPLLKIRLSDDEIENVEETTRLISEES